MLAEALGKQAWKPLERLPKYEILTEPRPKAFRYKEQAVVERQFKNQKLSGEDLAEIDYQPLKCGRPYRLIILLPCQVVRTTRRVIYRVLSYNRWLKDLFATWARLESFSTA